MGLDFSRSSEVGKRLGALVPGGGHTYAKGADQYPAQSPAVLSHGRGCRVWDVDGNEFIEYGMGLRAVSLGHAFPEVVDAVREVLDVGTNFTRPAKIELDCAERFAATIASAEMVKFTKDGSTATTAALKLARASTGRDLVAICADHPFFSYDDWFMVTTTLDGGIPDVEATMTTVLPVQRPGQRGARSSSNIQSGSPRCSSSLSVPSRRSRGSSREFVSCALATAPYSCSTR